jgi:DNA topoisomerase-1
VNETLETSEKSKGEKQLGTDPETGKPVTVKIGRFGPMVQIGDAGDDEKPRFASIPKSKSLETITLEEALDLFRLPRSLGDFEGEELLVSTGRYGPYVKHKNKFYSLEKSDDPFSVSAERAIELIKAKKEQEKNRVIKEFSDAPGLQVLNGRYGPYIAFEKKNYKIPKGKKPADLTHEECMEIIRNAPGKSPGKKK